VSTPRLASARTMEGRRGGRKPRRDGLRLAAALLTVVLVGTSAACSPTRERAENIIVIIGDGMGAAHRDLIRLTTVGRERELAMDQLPHQGWTRTDPADPGEAVTDSAAAATAVATGVRTARGAIAVDPDGDPVTTLLERAEDAGRATGLVTTSQVTDATPAAFGAHVSDRDEHGEIARQYLEETGIDVVLGGGAEQWTEGASPEDPPAEPAEGGEDGVPTLVERAQQLGYQHVRGADELAAADGDLLLGLFADEEMFEDDDDLEAIYDPAVPLPVMAGKALEVLSRDEDGFFLVIEEEGIDAMSHRHDAGLVIEAGRALDETVSLARAFADEHGSTLIVVLGDHETGGLTIEPGDGSGEAGEGSLPVAGTDLSIDVGWTTDGHTAAPTPAAAEGPGAAAMVDVRHHTDLHDLVLDAMD
jgi:alkaline phosphatase